MLLNEQRIVILYNFAFKGSLRLNSRKILTSYNNTQGSKQGIHIKKIVLGFIVEMSRLA